MCVCVCCVCAACVRVNEGALFWSSSLGRLPFSASRRHETARHCAVGLPLPPPTRNVVAAAAAAAAAAADGVPPTRRTSAAVAVRPRARPRANVADSFSRGGFVIAFAFSGVCASVVRTICPQCLCYSLATQCNNSLRVYALNC